MRNPFTLFIGCVFVLPPKTLGRLAPFYYRKYPTSSPTYSRQPSLTPSTSMLPSYQPTLHPSFSPSHQPSLSSQPSSSPRPSISIHSSSSSILQQQHRIDSGRRQGAGIGFGFIILISLIGILLCFAVIQLTRKSRCLPIFEDEQNRSTTSDESGLMPPIVSWLESLPSRLHLDHFVSDMSSCSSSSSD